MPVTINGTTGIAGPDGSASTPAVQGTDSNTGLFYPAADTVALSTGGTERMRIDSSGNVGIGTSSPSYLLHAAGTNPRINVSASSTGYAGYRASNTSGTFQVAIDDSTGSNYLGTAYGRVIYSDGAYPLQFATNATERMRIDSSGNVGIGETSPGTRLDVKGNGVPLTINSANSNGNKVQFEDNGTVKAYFGTTSFGGVVDCCFQASDSSGNTRFSVVAASGTIGLNTQPATTGTGITFPATQSASSDANTLDDYEEGTWTPSVGGNATYNYQQGNYTKVGRLVVARFAVSIGTLGTGSTTTLSGLPFSTASVTGRWGGCIHYFAGLAANAINLLIYADGASTNMLFSTVTSSGAGITVDNAAIFGNGAVVQATVIYQV